MATGQTSGGSDRGGSSGGGSRQDGNSDGEGEGTDEDEEWDNIHAGEENRGSDEGSDEGTDDYDGCESGDERYNTSHPEYYQPPPLDADRHDVPLFGLWTTCPEEFAQVSHAVCARLASALPHLQSLTLRGCCRDAALDTFGALCPGLTHLQVEALTVPITALQNLHQHLPSLVHLCIRKKYAFPPAPKHLTRRGDRAVYRRCAIRHTWGLTGQYVDAALTAIHDCTSLRTLQLDLDKPPGGSGLCTRMSSHPLMPYLEEVQSSCELPRDLYLPLMGGVQRLTLPELSFHPDSEFSMVPALEGLQGLRQLTAAGDVELRFSSKRGDHMRTLSLLKQRMVLGGLHFIAPEINLHGSSRSIQADLKALHPLPGIVHCDVSVVDGSPRADLCAEAARAFPGMRELTVTECQFVYGHRETGLTGKFFAPLGSCAHLEKLSLRMHLTMSTSEIAQLILRVPSLRELTLEDSEINGLADGPGIMAHVHSHGRKQVVLRLMGDQGRGGSHRYLKFE
ncbi:MAG: hypothetical protein WDW38_005133 [Sanguina aurantia]